MKKMGILVLIIGLSLTALGTFMLLNKPSDNVAVTDKSEINPQQNSSASEHDSPSPAEIGKQFEDFIVTLVNKNDLMTLKRRSDDRIVDGTMASDNMNPDLLIELRLGNQRHPFAIECKWRKGFNSNDEVTLSYNKQLERYRQYAGREGIDVFIVAGVGGSAQQPESVYIIPLQSLTEPKCSRSFLEPFKRATADKMLYYNPSEHSLH